MPWKGKATNLGLGQHTGNNHLLFFYFASLHISRPQKKRDAGKVVLVERAVQRGVLGEQSCLIYFYFRAPNTACGEEGVEVEYSSTSSSTSTTVSTVFGEQGAWNPGPQRARVRRQPWEVPLITRRSDPRTLKNVLCRWSPEKEKEKGTFLRILLQGCKHCIFPRHDYADVDDVDADVDDLNMKGSLLGLRTIPRHCRDWTNWSDQARMLQDQTLLLLPFLSDPLIAACSFHIFFA